MEKMPWKISFRPRLAGVAVILLVLAIAGSLVTIAFTDAWRDRFKHREDSASSSESERDEGGRKPSKTGQRHPSVKETAAFNSFLKELSEEKNRNARKRLLERMVVDFGRQFPEQMLELIQKYDPVPEAPGPLLSLVIMNAGVNPEFTEIGLRAFPAGKDHSFVLGAAVSGTKLEDLPGFLNSLHTGQPEDDREVARLIWQQSLLGRPDISEDDLNRLMTSVNSKEVAQAISREFGRRLRNNYPNGLEDVPPAEELVKNVAEPFRQDALTRFYEGDLQGIVALSPVELADKGVPDSLLSEYVQKLARVRDGNDGPLIAIQATADIPANLREDYLTSVVELWTRSNPEEAGKEILKLPAGSDRDILISGMVDLSVRSGDPEAAKRWTGLITDSSRRLDAEKKIAAPR